MPTKKYEWTDWDHCAANFIAATMQRQGLSDRGLAGRLDNAVSYNRILDLRKGLKAPVRLSEFLAICGVCGADPTEALREIIAEAKRIEAERDRDRRVEETKRILEEHPLELAAYTDPDKAQYIEHGDGEDPA